MLKKTVPLVITFVFGTFMVLEYFTPLRFVAEAKKHFYNAGIAIMGVTYVLGLINIVAVNLPVIRRRRPDWPYKIVMILGLLTMLVLGFTWGKEPGTPFNWMFTNFYVPLQATMFALLAFYIASAAFRAFRARTPEAALLLGAAVFVMLGRVPIGQFLWGLLPWHLIQSPHVPPIGDDAFFWGWIMDIPNLAGKRAIMIGAALGAISTGLRVILGLERSYLGGE
ncbi:MAG: hypothetical protein D6729_02495 [Deltaproteobacteria bacterium]|nr:MAG: hypothetical protein D6729_02495 [Deltaproteobacteria bacterium]